MDPVASTDLLNIDGNGDAGLRVVQGAEVEVSSTLVSNNCHAWGYGAAVSFNRSSGTLVHVRVQGNGCKGVQLGISDAVLHGMASVGNASAGLRLFGGSEATVSDSDLSNNGEGVVLFAASDTFSATHTNIWGNGVDLFGPVSFTPGLDGNLSVDPAYLDLSSDPFAWDLHLAPTSPLIDAGDPLLSDPDGSPADIGAFGGPGADLWDLDGDGWPSWWQPGPYDPNTHPALGLDCDDQDAEVGPDDC